MKRRTLSDTISDEHRRFIEQGTQQPQSVAAPVEIPAPIVEPEPIDEPTEMPVKKKAAEPKRSSTPDLPTVLVSQTYRLPAHLVKELTRVAFERKMDRIAPWSHQDIVADALDDWIRKHARK
jgi:hypothetical protein